MDKNPVLTISFKFLLILINYSETPNVQNSFFNSTLYQMKPYILLILSYLIIGISLNTSYGQSIQQPIKKEIPRTNNKLVLKTENSDTKVFVNPKGNLISKTVLKQASSLEKKANVETKRSASPSLALNKMPSPCTCISSSSCDGATYANQALAVADFNANSSNTGTGCFDLTSQAIPADDGLTYQFCYEYTHSSAESFFASNGVIWFNGVTTECTNTSIITSNVYIQGDCTTALDAQAVTTDNWAAYPATNGTTYEICYDVTANAVECTGGTISGVCTYVHPHTVVCNRYGGNIVEPNDINFCIEDGAMPLSTTGEVTDASFPDIGWGIWLLDDPNNVYGGAPAAGSPPPNQNPLDDANFLGLIFGPGTVFNLNSFADGATYYIAPFAYNSSNNTIDAVCSGLAPGYTVYMNPALTTNATLTDCDFNITFSGGYPSVNSNADYAWSYVTPSGTIVTGTGTPIAFTADEDGDYIFSLDNDGLGANSCSLPDFLTTTVAGCSCEADAGTFATLGGNVICFEDQFIISTSGDYAGSHEDGSALDEVANGGDNDFFNGVAYSVYTAAPTSTDLLSDPNFLGIIGSSPATSGGADGGIIITNTTAILTGVGLSPNTSYWFTTTYAFDLDNAGGIIVAVDLGGDGTNDCFDTNIADAEEVVFLEDITSTVNQTCGTGGADIDITLNGGMPAYDSSLYTITGDGPGGTVANGGTYTISGFAYSSTYSITVMDDNGCSIIITGQSIDLAFKK